MHAAPPAAPPLLAQPTALSARRGGQAPDASLADRPPSAHVSRHGRLDMMGLHAHARARTHARSQAGAHARRHTHTMGSSPRAARLAGSRLAEPGLKCGGPPPRCLPSQPSRTACARRPERARRARKRGVDTEQHLCQDRHCDLQTTESLAASRSAPRHQYLRGRNAEV